MLIHGCAPFPLLHLPLVQISVQFQHEWGRDILLPCLLLCIGEGPDKSQTPDAEIVRKYTYEAWKSVSFRDPDPGSDHMVTPGG